MERKKAVILIIPNDSQRSEYCKGLFKSTLRLPGLSFDFTQDGEPVDGSGALNPDLKIGVWRRQMYQESFQQNRNRTGGDEGTIKESTDGI